MSYIPLKQYGTPEPRVPNLQHHQYRQQQELPQKQVKQNTSSSYPTGTNAQHLEAEPEKLQQLFPKCTPKTTPVTTPKSSQENKSLLEDLAAASNLDQQQQPGQVRKRKKKKKKKKKVEQDVAVENIIDLGNDELNQRTEVPPSVFTHDMNAMLCPTSPTSSSSNNNVGHQISESNGDASHSEVISDNSFMAPKQPASTRIQTQLPASSESESSSSPRRPTAEDLRMNSKQTSEKKIEIAGKYNYVFSFSVVSLPFTWWKALQ